jgi:hypothetical protein
VVNTTPPSATPTDAPLSHAPAPAIKNNDYFSSLMKRSSAPPRQPSAFDAWTATEEDIGALDDATLAEVHELYATGQKRGGSGNRFGIQGVANRVAEGRQYHTNTGHAHATQRTHKHLKATAAEMEKRKLPVSEVAKKWATTASCKPQTKPRRKDDHDREPPPGPAYGAGVRKGQRKRLDV